MKNLTLPVVDLQAYDRIEAYQSTKTGAWLLYRYRRLHNHGDEQSLLVETYGSRMQAMRIRNRLRMLEETLRTAYEYDARLKTWPALDVAVSQEGVHGQAA
jgi:hypothetical protein